MMMIHDENKQTQIHILTHVHIKRTNSNKMHIETHKTHMETHETHRFT